MRLVDPNRVLDEAAQLLIARATFELERQAVVRASERPSDWRCDRGCGDDIRRLFSLIRP